MKNEMMESTSEELCAALVGAAEKIMDRYSEPLEEACAIVGITEQDYQNWKDYEESERQKRMQRLEDNEATKTVMAKIGQLLDMGITLESACEFARISVDDYQEYQKRKNTK